jgi:hypothetical protein
MKKKFLIVIQDGKIVGDCKQLYKLKLYHNEWFKTCPVRKGDKHACEKCYCG